MTEIFGKHSQDYNEIRRLCLICHGLDLSSSILFSNSTYYCASETTKQVFQNLVSGSLLNLAVALRVNIYQGKMTGPKYAKLLHCGFLYDDNDLVSKEFTIKDVCDKIIHADTVSKEALPPHILGDSKMTMQFKGKHNRKSWTLDLSVELFTEAVLNFVDELEHEGT